MQTQNTLKNGRIGVSTKTATEKRVRRESADEWAFYTLHTSFVVSTNKFRFKT